jgi:hypothetical protein
MGHAGVAALAFGGSMTLFVKFFGREPWSAFVPLGYVLIFAGVALLAVTGFSTILSGLGPIVVGAEFLVIGLLPIVFPAWRGTAQLTYTTWEGNELNIVLNLYGTSGILLVLGVALAAAGVASASRVGRKASAWARVAVALGVLLLGSAVFVLIPFGTVLRSNAEGPQIGAVLAFVFGLILLGAVAGTIRWSALGASVWGFITAVVGTMAIFINFMEPIAIAGLPMPFLWTPFGSGGIMLATGVTVLWAAIGAKIAARRLPPAPAVTPVDAEAPAAV